MDNDKIINEIFGGQHKTLTTGIIANPGSHLTNKDRQFKIGQQIVPDKNQPSFKPDRLSGPKFIDKAWQDFITSMLVKGNSNLFINIAPSAGKTTPVLEAYKTLLTNCSPTNIPKIIWVAETKLLASQIQNELRNMFYELIIGTKNHKGVYQRLPAFMIAPDFKGIIAKQSTPTNLYDIQLTSSQLERIRYIIKQWTGTMMAADANADKPTEKSIAITCTYSFATQLIKKYNPAIVVIDEVQERFKSENKNVESESDKVFHFFNNVKSANESPGTSLAVLTGSLNHDTAKYIIRYMDSTYLQDNPFKYVTYASGINNIITGEPNKANITVLPTDMVRKDIPKLIINQIKGKSGNNLIALFSKQKINEFTKLIISSTPRRDMRSVLGITDHSVNVKYTSHMRTTAKLNPKQSHGTISNQAKLAKNSETSPNKLFELFINMKDSQLQDAIAHGFGYIMGAEENIRVYDNTDIFLVEQLFVKGLIYSIIATTAVGVGVNLKVRSLFIPSIDVFNKDVGSSIKMSISSLAQLVHRAGRKPDETAVVFCNKNDLTLINKIMGSGDPSDMIELIPAESDKNRVGINDRFDYALNSWLYIKTKKYRQSLIYKLITNPN